MMNHIKLSIVLCLWVVLLLFLGCGKVGKNKASETEITTMRKDAESEWASMFEMVCEENGCYIDDYFHDGVYQYSYLVIPNDCSGRVGWVKFPWVKLI